MSEIIKDCTDMDVVKNSHDKFENQSQPAVQMSKRQMKKLKKLQEWESKKIFKRLKEREKYRLKRLEAIAKGEPTRIGPSRKALKLKKISSETCDYTIAIDLSFNDLMLDRDISKCVKQLLRIYTINRRSSAPMNLYFTSIIESNRLHQTLVKNDGYQNWDVNIKSDSFMEVFDKTKLVYLSSDSENVLERLNKDKVYVIGGLVDHNHNKGLCLKKANELGIRHARLPLSENVIIKTRTVLSIFHVFEILLRISEGENWQDALLHVLPMRKGAKPKTFTDEINDDNNDKRDNSCNNVKVDDDNNILAESVGTDISKNKNSIENIS